MEENILGGAPSEAAVVAHNGYRSSSNAGEVESAAHFAGVQPEVSVPLQGSHANSAPFNNNSFNNSTNSNPSHSNGTAHASYDSSPGLASGVFPISAVSGRTEPQPPALFWNSPLTGQDELNWFVPPLPHKEEASGQTEAMLDQFGRMMDNQARRAWLLKWNYKTRAAAAAAEQSHVEQEAQAQLGRIKVQAEREIERIDADIVRLNTQRQDLEKDLLATQNAFAESAACAGLHCEVTLPEPEAAASSSRFRRRGGATDDQEDVGAGHDLHSAPIGKINPQVVEDALNDSVPTLQEMAGEYGVGPVGHSDMLAKILSFFMQFLAPLVAGMMLALCLGTLVGILDIDTLQRSDSGPQLVLSAALGFVIVYLMGELFQTAVATLARSLETRDPDLGHKPLVPRFRSNMGIAIVLLVVALGLGVAEVTAEGMGIRQLHQQQITKQNRFRGTPALRRPGTGPAAVAATPRPETEELSLAVYLIIGTLISGPYLAYKTAKGWGENESHLREAWLTHRQRVWLDERRAQPDVQQAFHHAYNVEQIESNLTRTRYQLRYLEEERMRAMNVELPANMQSRRREARAAAVGEAARLQQSLEELVDAHEPMPQPARVVRAGQAGAGRVPNNLRP